MCLDHLWQMDDGAMRIPRGLGLAGINGLYMALSPLCGTLAARSYWLWKRLVADSGNGLCSALQTGATRKRLSKMIYLVAREG